jgi:pilus assembly protein CpaC
MANQSTIRALLIAVPLAATLMTLAHAADPGLPRGTQVINVVGSETSSRPLSLGVGKAVVIDLPRDVKDVLVADPSVANAVVRSTRRAYMIGAKVGQTNIFFFDAEGRQIAGFDIAVKRDLNGIREAIRQALPRTSEIRVEPLGDDGLVLTGIADSAAEAQTAFEIASRLIGASPSGTATASGSNSTSINISTAQKDSPNPGGVNVVNAITIRARDQINLRVTVAEVQREVIKQLGINLSGSVGGGSSVINFNTETPFTAYGQELSNTSIVPSYGARTSLNTNLDPNLSGGMLRSRLGASIRAMERAGVMRLLAEPNLTAISGETANFLAGGEFPVVTGVTCQGLNSCTPTVEFKKFGISLGFTPVVLSEGRISLKVTTEVSELSTEAQLFSSGFTVPSLRVRRADTTVEIPSGGALAMAGMIHEQTKQQINGLPGLMQLPVLGSLFKSRDYVNRQTELMILVTPYVVRPVKQKDLSRPDDGFADSADPSAFFMGRVNRLYGLPGKIDPNTNYRGKIGFIVD